MPEIASQELQRSGGLVFEMPTPVISANAGFAGLLYVRGPVRIDGQLEGELIASGTVWIAETARVKARVEARQVVVAGELAGEIRADEKNEILATARVTAALHTPRLVLADGCFFEGRCHAGQAETRPVAEAAQRPVPAPAMP